MTTRAREPLDRITALANLYREGYDDMDQAQHQLRGYLTSRVPYSRCLAIARTLGVTLPRPRPHNREFELDAFICRLVPTILSVE